MSFFIYDANYFIKFLNKNYFINGLKNLRLYILYRYCIVVLLQYLNMPYTISEQKPVDCICKCGAIIKYSNMQKHLLSAKHRRDTYVYIRTCCVLTNPPIPSSRSEHFVYLRPTIFYTTRELTQGSPLVTTLNFFLIFLCNHIVIFEKKSR